MENQKIKYDERLISLLEQALDLQANERDEFLRHECAHDVLLYEDLRDELQWDQRMGRFLLDPLLARIDIDDPFKPGDLIDNRFLIVRCVGEGGMGIVYEAVDKLVDERRALKCAKPGFEPRLPSEARAAVRISHDNVCRVCEIHSTKTRHGTLEFLSMEFVQGHILSEYIKEKGRLNPAETDSVLRQLCKGLGAAHQQGLLHRDLKSNNVMLTKSRDGSLRAVIMDFGLATGSGPTMPRSSTLRGALPYIAPEVLQGGKATVASDIYSLGVIAYEMVTGQLPVLKDISSQSHTAKPVLPPNKLIRGLGSHLDKLILKCMNPNPGRRVSSCEEILHQLDRLYLVFARTIRIFRAKAGLYVLVSVLPALITMILLFEVGRLVVPLVDTNPVAGNPIEMWKSMGWISQLAVIVLFVSTCWTPRFVTGYAVSHLTLNQCTGHYTRFRSILAEMLTFIPASVVLSLFIGLPAVIGSSNVVFGVLIVPLLFTLFGLTMPIMVAEDIDLFRALRRSLLLVRRIFGRVLVFSGIAWVCDVGGTVLAAMIIYPITAIYDRPITRGITLAAILIAAIIGQIVFSWLSIIFALFYCEALLKCESTS